MARLTYDQIAGPGEEMVALAILASGQNPDGTPFTMPTGKDTASEPGTSVAVGSTSTAVVAANPDRAELTIVNDSADPVYLRLAGTGAALNSGIRLNAGGGSYTTTAYRGAVSAIQADTLATRRLLVAEV